VSGRWSADDYLDRSLRSPYLPALMTHASMMCRPLLQSVSHRSRATKRKSSQGSRGAGPLPYLSSTRNMVKHRLTARVVTRRYHRVSVSRFHQSSL
jgi:hypothetical protein